MWDIFNPKRRPIFKGKIFNEDIRYTKEYYTSVLDKIVKYRIQYDWFLNNKNILIRLIHRMISPTGLNDFEYFKIIESNGYSIARELLLGTRYNKAEWYFNHSFKGSKELYYIDFTPIDLSKTPAEWKNYNPLEVLYTDSKILDFTVPDPMVENNVTIVYKINIFKLFLQYKYWLNYRRMLDLDTGISRYIAQYVYPKSLYSFIDYSLWNIYNELVKDTDYEIEFNNGMPFSISDYSRKIKRGLLEYVNRYKDTKTLIDGYLLGLPSIANENVYDLLRLTEGSSTQQGLWLPLLTRTQDVYNILLALGNNGKIANGDYVGEIKRYLRKLRNSGTILPSNTPKDIAREVEKNLFKIEYLV